jgi:hypothetical protein
MIFGYVLEKAYSKGGEPIMQKSVLIDPEIKKPCFDIFLNMMT